MRVVVVGSGVVGLLTAIECVLAGAEVDLVEQAATIPSVEATSYDRHRVVRALHRGEPALTRAAIGLDADWLAFEELVGRRCYHRTGVLTVGPSEADLAVLAEAGVVAERLSGRALADRYPQLRFGPDRQAVLELDAGTVLADQALLGAAWWLRGRPAVLTYPRSPVTRVTESGAVMLAGGDVLGGDAVVLAAGPWSRALLPPSIADQLVLQRQTMLSYRPVDHHLEWASAPAVLGLGDAGDAWLMPPVAGTDVRLSASGACRPAARLADRQTPPEWRECLTDAFAGVLTGFDRTLVRDSSEGYYLADPVGDGPMLVQLGAGPVWAYAACGGMSFKFAPVLARTLADLALGRPARPTGLAGVDVPQRHVTVRRELFI